MVNIYKYTYVKSKAEGLFIKADHREIIDKYSQDGWRFITVIPMGHGGNGIVEFDLVFEKEVKGD